MRFVTTFIAILAATPAFAAPVTKEQQSIDSLVAAAHGDPVVLLKQLKPITEQITSIIASMIPSNATAPPSVGAATGTPIPPPNEDHPVPTAPPAPPAPQPGTDEAPVVAAAAEPTPDTVEAAAADPAPTDSPTDATTNDSGSVQRRDVGTHASSETATATTTNHANKPAKKATSAKKGTPAKKAKSATKAITMTKGTVQGVKASDVRRLRDLLTEAKLIEEAIESIFIAKGQNIDEMPSDKTAGGVAWGIANGPLLAIAKMVNFDFSKQI